MSNNISNDNISLDDCYSEMKKWVNDFYGGDIETSHTADTIFDDDFYNDKYDSSDPIVEWVERPDFHIDFNNNHRVELEIITYFKKEEMFSIENIIDYVRDVINQHITNSAITYAESASEESIYLYTNHIIYVCLNKEWIYSITETKPNIHKAIHSIIRSFRIINEIECSESETHSKTREDILKKLKVIIGFLLEYNKSETDEPTLFDNISIEKNDITKDIKIDCLKITKNKPTHLCIAKDILSNKLNDKKNPIVFDERFKLNVGGGKETIFLLSYEDEAIDFRGRQITAYDKAVLNAVSTLFAFGNNPITDREIYRELKRVDGGATIEALEKIRETMKKYRFLLVYIDRTEEAKLYEKKIDQFELNATMISYDEVSVKISGNEVRAYKLLDKPILFRYAEDKGQLIRIENKLLDIPINKTDEVIAIMHYLVRQIAWIKNDKGKQKRNSCITYQSIYDELGLTEPTKQKAEKIRNHIDTILNYWIENNYIKSYENYKENKKIVGIKIENSTNRK